MSQRFPYRHSIVPGKPGAPTSRSALESKVMRQSSYDDRSRFQRSILPLVIAMVIGPQALAQQASEASARAREPRPKVAEPVAVDLDKVEVRGERAEGYAVRSAGVATRTDTPLLSTPMTVQVLPQALLRDQAVGSSGLTDVLAYAGVQALGSDRRQATTDNLVFRGFTSTTTLWNGFRIEDATPSVGYANGPAWMDDVARLEVLMGPASILYGRVEPGGVVNVVSLKPDGTDGGEAWTGAGSWSGRTFGLDVGGVLDDGKQLRYRLVVAGDAGDSWFRHGGDYRSAGISPKLQWRPTSATMVTFEGQYRRMQGPTGQSYMPTDAAIGSPLPILPRDTLLPGNDARFTQDRTLIAVEHALGEDWTLAMRYLHAVGNSPEANNAMALGFDVQPDGSAIDAYLMVGNTRSRQRTEAVVLEAIGHAAWFGARHTLLLGIDHYDRGFDQHGGWDFSQVTDYLAPTRPLPAAETDAWTIDGRESGFYVQDQVALPHGWHALVGGRFQWTRERTLADTPSLGLPPQDMDYRKHAFLPRVGLLWQVHPWWSAYYSYAENMGANAGLDYSGRSIDPEWARQHEVGVKAQWFDGRLQAAVSLFELTKTNVASEDPEHPGYNIGVGEVRSRGYEASLQGALTPAWNVLLNLAGARPRVIDGTTQSSAYSGPSIIAGQLLPFVSNRTAAVWTTYDLAAEAPAGWTFGAGVNWASAPNPQDQATVETGSRTLVSAMLGYRTRVGAHPIHLQLNVDNLFDVRYLTFQADDVAYGGNTLGGIWGAPRQFTLGLRMGF